VLGTRVRTRDLTFTEDARKLHKALSARAFATPFLWTFGDGRTARGLAVHHRYRQPGWYKVNVNYYYAPQRRWVPFDSAQLRIDPLPGEQHHAPPAAPVPWAIGAAATMIGCLAVVALHARHRASSTPTTKSPGGPHRQRAARVRGR
jgi:hypothetical protein